MPRLAPIRAALAGLVTAVSLGGCSAWNYTVLSTVNGMRPELPSAEWDKVDGNYKGIALLAAAESPACPTTNFGKIEVGDQRLYFAYMPDTIFIAPIQTDGSVHAIAGRSYLDGTVSGGRLEFTVRTPVCESHYNMRYVI